MSVVPSKLTPPMFIAVSRAVAVAALPLTSPVRSPVTELNRTSSEVPTAWPMAICPSVMVIPVPTFTPPRISLVAVGKE